MQPKTPKLLDEIRDAAAFIAEVTHDVTEDEYRRNRLLRQSVERNFITEATLLLGSANGAA